MTINWISSSNCSEPAHDALRRMALVRDQDTVTLTSLECAGIIEHIEDLYEEPEFNEIELFEAQGTVLALEKEIEELKTRLAEKQKGE